MAISLYTLVQKYCITELFCCITLDGLAAERLQIPFQLTTAWVDPDHSFFSCILCFYFAFIKLVKPSVTSYFMFSFDGPHLLF